MSLEDQVRRVVPELLSKVLGRGIEVRITSREGVLEIHTAELPSPLIVVSVPEAKRPLVARAANTARTKAEDLPRALPVVAAPHMTAAGMEAALSAGAGWLDLAGNLHIADPGSGFMLHVEGKRPRVKRRGRPASAFAPKSARVARALLTDPDRRWAQKDLIDATDLAQGMVSRVLSRLRELDLVAQDEMNRYWAPAPRELLDAWKDEYDYSRQGIVAAHLSGAGIDLAREVVRRLQADRVSCALTGLPAAWLYDGFAQFRLISVYVEDDPLQAAETVDARVEERGANIHFVRPADTGVYYDLQEIEGLPCVHPIQVYLDLSRLPERATEAADHLRQHSIGW